VFFLATIVGLLFGGTDQVLGSISMPWATSLSLLSAPWLILPFCFGCTQRVSKSALLIGLVATYAALLGYGVMTLSPVEGVHLSQQHQAIVGLLRSERKVLFGGLISGPLYGLLGFYWRTRRAWVSAALVAGAVCLEPLVEDVVGHLPRQPAVWLAEIGAGTLLALYFALTVILSRRGRIYLRRVAGKESRAKRGTRNDSVL
jgi:hypothetical protein